jgi:hypothetical protein
MTDRPEHAGGLSGAIELGEYDEPDLARLRWDYERAYQVRAWRHRGRPVWTADRKNGHRGEPLEGRSAGELRFLLRQDSATRTRL